MIPDIVLKDFGYSFKGSRTPFLKDPGKSFKESRILFLKDPGYFFLRILDIVFKDPVYNLKGSRIFELFIGKVKEYEEIKI